MASGYRRRILSVFMGCLVIGASLLPAVVSASDDSWLSYDEFGNQAFARTYNRVDAPIPAGVKRTWVWGSGARTPVMLEPYAEAPGGMRMVQYFDKSRMEVNDPAADSLALWYVTNGLLVIEMVEGRLQIGDALFDHTPDPSTFAIAGDQDGTSGTTYADIKSLGLRSRPALAVGSSIRQTIQNGEIVQGQQFAQYNVTAAHRVQVDGIDHTVASVFWDFMNSEGLVYDNWMLVTEKIFLNPFYATGYPITEAYWDVVNVGGVPRDVLWQCFERRCLTYTPSNADGWKVETGNVGQHYYYWRYGPTGPDTEMAKIAVVAIEDGGVQGPVIGCNDSLVMFDHELQKLESLEHQIQLAVQRLFVTQAPGYTNVLFGQDLIVGEVTIAGGVATLHISGALLSGGVCDDPRILETIHATAKQFGGISDVVIRVNGQVWTGGGM
jgi:hypothetical protein